MKHLLSNMEKLATADQNPALKLKVYKHQTLFLKQQNNIASAGTTLKIRYRN